VTRKEMKLIAEELFPNCSWLEKCLHPLLFRWINLDSYINRLLKGKFKTSYDELQSGI